MSVQPLRLTQATQMVLRALLVDPTKEAYGAEIGQAAGLPSGTVTPILARLENAGLIGHRVEEVDPRKVGRPRRKYYSFTPDGAEHARVALARAYAETHAVGHDRGRQGLAGDPA